jgi:integrase
LGGIRIDKIRTAHIANMITKRLTAGVAKRTAKLDIIVLRNVLKQARDVDELIKDLPIPPGLNRKLKSIAPTRVLFTPEELERLCKAALAKRDDGKPVTKNGVQFCDYVRVMAYSGARRNEAFALRWTDVDFENEQLNIERQSSLNGKDDTTKNAEPRTVDFTPALKKQLQEMDSRRAPDSQWLFPSPL